MPRKAQGDLKTNSKLASLHELEAAELSASPPVEEEPDISVYRPDREGIRKVLGDLEADVMEYVWENVSNSSQGQGITVREVYEAFRLRRVIAYTTVMSTMARLARKHLLRFHKEDNTYIYTPSLSKEEFIDNFVARILVNLLVSFSHSTETHLERLNSGDTAERIASLRTRLVGLREASAEADPVQNLSDSSPASQARPALKRKKITTDKK